MINGDVTVLVPANAFGDPTRVSIDRIAVPDPGLGASLFGFAIRAEDEATGQTVQVFGAALTLVIDAGAWDLTGIDPGSLTIAELSDGSWSTIASGSTGSLVASTDHAGTFAVQGRLLPARVDIDHRSDAPPGGRHRLEPGSMLVVTVAMRTASRLASGLLVETIPAGWSLVDGDGGLLDPAASTLTWPLRSVEAGSTVEHTLRLRAPSVPFDGQLAPASTFSVRVEQGAAVTDGPDLGILVAPRVLMTHVTAGRVERAGEDAAYLAPDRPLIDEPRYQVFRLRFEVGNADSLPVRLAPRLEFRRSSEGAFMPLPAGENVPGVAFYAAPEWVRLPSGGTALGTSTHVVVDARDVPGDATADGRAPVDGTRVVGLNPAPEIVLPPRSRTVVEFSVRATVDAAYGAGYDFRLTNLGETFPGAAETLVVLEPVPQVELSAGQRVGLSAGEAGPTSGTPIKFALSSPTAPGATGDTTTDQPPSLRFALVPPSGAAGTANAGPAVDEPIHGPTYGLTADSCAACHSTHRGAGSQLTTTAPPQLGTCGSCHDGVNAPGIQAAYAAAPQDDPADRAYYGHDPAATSGHEGDGSDALAGQLNRHNECADCHNPHNATTVAAVSTTSGWTGSGRVAGASSVTAANGSSGSSPTYGVATATAFEYELCLKCHSGYTELPSNAGLPPSRYALDKGVEFNPANLSYHPVEAPGTNATTAMLYSLRGTSPFKQWTFTPDSTIRCVNCHADAGVLASAASSGSAVTADASLPVHASPNRGILLSTYLDRQLKGPIAPYDPSDFGLCYLCHAEAPFRDTSGEERPDTNFPYHGFHVSGANMLDHGSNGTDIDAAGDGGGLATCSECHFRIHSTSFAVNNQAAGSRLVNFAPNVTPPTGGVLGWRPKGWLVDGTAITGSCTLKCHGQSHSEDY